VITVRREKPDDRPLVYTVIEKAFKRDTEAKLVASFRKENSESF
jgi:predicted N-acetyltransferase YhbS